MLEFVAGAFGWINPLLRQMARSPCRADKPQSARHPLSHLYVCVCCMCLCVHVFQKKNKKLAGFQWWRWRMYLFWFWNTMWNLLGAPLVFVYLHMHTVVCFSKTLHKHKAHYLAGKSGSWLVSYQSIFIVLIKINTSLRGFITTVPWILKDFQGRVVYLWPVFALTSKRW